MGINPKHATPRARTEMLTLRHGVCFAVALLILLAVETPAAQPWRTPESRAAETAVHVQVLQGRISASGLQIYRVTGLKKGQRLYARAEASSGYLDPLIALIKPNVKLDELAKEPLDRLVETLSREHDPIEVTRQIFDDTAGHYYATLSVEVPADGEYRLAIGSSLARPSAGTYRLTVGIDAPEVLTDHPQDIGSQFVFAEKDVGALERGTVSVTGELTSDQPVRFYNLADIAAGQTFYAYAEALDGDLKPMLTLYDRSDKPVAYGNFTATHSRGSLKYELPRKASNYRLMISSEGRDGKSTAGNFRLIMGLNAPEIFEGEAESTGRELIRQPIPVRIGIKLQQITSVDQKAENFGVVATLVLHWRDPGLAFDPETVQDRHQLFEGDAFSAEMSRRGQAWPQYTLVNQQGNRWAQNRLVVIRPDGEAAYLERFSTTLQAPDFDFRDFPFDIQKFFIRIDLLAPEWLFSLEEIEGYSQVGEKLGEEEWVVTDFATSFSQGAILQRPVARFNFVFSAKRHVAYYFFRILLPLAVIIAVSWILFFLKDYAKRVDAAGANLLLFIAFNFAISSDLPRLGYLTFLDTLLISAFLVTAVVLILSVYLRRQDMKGRKTFVAKVDRYVILFYPLAYIGTMVTVTFLFR
jgi:hypothetical protein